MRDLPSPLRAAVGLAATVVDEAKRLPDRVLEVPMLAVSRALQLSLRAQQQYAALAARGEEVLAGDRITDEAPEWATFDDPVDLPAATNGAGSAHAAKSVPAPRAGSPSAFDIVADPDAEPDPLDGALAEDDGEIVPDTD
jgi:hypothetical protein